MNYVSVILKIFEAKRNLKKSKEELLLNRDKKFRKVVKSAYNNSKFYYRLYSESGICKEDLKKIDITQLPTINKEVFIKNFDEIVTKSELKKQVIDEFVSKDNDINNKYLNKYTIVHTSGSTGEPTYFVYDKKAWNYIIASAVTACLIDVPSKELISKVYRGVRVAYLAATQGRYGGVMIANDGIKGLGYKELLIDVNTPINKWVDEFNEFKPNIIIGYPSALKIVSELIEQDKVQVNPFKVISCGEPLTKSLRLYIEKNMEVQIINVYGSSESLIIGVERNSEEGLKFLDDINYVEIVDGYVYITSLYNYSQPLIRYKLNDKVMIRDGGKIDFLLGRSEDLMWFENKSGKGDFIHPLIVEGFCITDLINYQFVQHSSKRFEILAEVKEGTSKKKVEKELKTKMDMILKEKKLENVKYKINFIENIAVNPLTGKKPLIRKNISEENGKTKVI